MERFCTQMSFQFGFVHTYKAEHKTPLCFHHYHHHYHQNEVAKMYLMKSLQVQWCTLDAIHGSSSKSRWERRKAAKHEKNAKKPSQNCFICSILSMHNCSFALTEIILIKRVIIFNIWDCAHWMQTMPALANHDERAKKLNPQSTKNAKKPSHNRFTYSIQF